MSQNPKINLSAIKNKTKSVDTKSEIVESLEEAIVEDNQNIIVETPVEEKKEVVSMVPKITLLSIKTNKSPLEIEEENEEKIEIEHEEKKEELTETLELIDEKNNEVSKEENLTDVILPEDKNIIDGSGKNMIKINEIINSKTDKNNIIDDIQEGRKNEEINKGANNEDIETTINNKKNKDEVEEIERKINEKVEEEINKKKPKLKTLSSEESDEKIGDKKTELFGNYKSEFIEKENKILENVVKEKKKFREKLKEQKTRIFLVLGLIFITFSVITMLFITNPEKHSLEIYKTTIKNNYKNIEKSTLTIISKPWVLNVVKIDSYNFDTYTQEEYFGGINYKFNNIIYSNKEDFDNALNKELGIKKQEEEKLKAEKLSANEKIEREKIEREKVRLEEQKNAMTKKLIKDFLLKTYLNK